MEGTKTNKIRYLSIGLFVIVIAIMPLVARSRYYVTIGNFIGIYGIVAMGLALLIGYAGQVSMAQAAFYGIGAYTSAILTTQVGLNPWLTMVAGAILSAGVAGIIGVPLLKLEGHVLAVATLALSIVVSTFFVELRPLTGGYDGIGGIPRLSVGGFMLKADFHYYYLIWAFLFFLFILSHNIVHSRVGRALRSIHRFSGGSEIGAESLGISPTKYKVQIFMLSAAYASIAGSLYAHWVTFINPDPFGIFISILMLIMVTIGGMGSLWGAIIGSCLVFLSGELFREMVPRLIPGASGEMEMIAYGLILILILLFMPRGLVSAPALFKSWAAKATRKASG
jgi:branched-chain amino acid transport system permease protein